MLIIHYCNSDINNSKCNNIYNENDNYNNYDNDNNNISGRVAARQAVDGRFKSRWFQDFF